MLNWNEIPAFTVAKGQAARIVLAVKKTRTDENARELSIEQRKCVFDGELSLKFYKNEPYTFSGCMKECRMTNAMEICGCLPPFYRPPHYENFTLCTAADLACLRDERIVDLKRCDNCQISCNTTVYTVGRVQSS